MLQRIIKIYNYANSFTDRFTYVKLDDKLDFEMHTNECLQLVVHKIDYGDMFYIKTYHRTLYKLQRLQNRAIWLYLLKAGRYIVNILNHETKLSLLENRGQTHLLNFVRYVLDPIRALRQYSAPVLMEIFPNNESFQRSVLYQGALE